MGTFNIDALLKLASSLSAVEALTLGLLLLCAFGGAVVAIFIAIRSFIEARAERRDVRRGNGPRT